MTLTVNTKQLHRAIATIGEIGSEFMRLEKEGSTLVIRAESNNIIAEFPVEIMSSDDTGSKILYCEFRDVSSLLPLRAETRMQLTDSFVHILFNSNLVTFPITFAEVNIPETNFTCETEIDTDTVSKCLNTLSKTSYFGRVLQTERPVECSLHNKFYIMYPTIWIESVGGIGHYSFTSKQLRLLKTFEPLEMVEGQNLLKFKNNFGSLYMPAQRAESNHQFSEVMHETEYHCSVNTANLLNNTQKLMKAVGDINVDVNVTEHGMGYTVTDVIQYSEALEGDIKCIFTTRLGYMETLLKLFPKDAEMKIYSSKKVVAFSCYGVRVILSKGR